MQFYIIAPLLLIPLYKWPKPTLAFIGVMSLVTIGVNFALTYVNDLSGGLMSLTVGRRQMELIYFPAHTRYAPWLFGMVLGYIMHKTRSKEIKINKILNLIIWAVVLVFMVAVVLGAYRFYRFDWENDVMLSSFYQALHRQAWSLLICWIIFAGHNGYGGPINWILSWGFWQPIGRLSYCIYLWHYQMQTARTVSRKTPMYFSEFELVAYFLGDVCFSSIVALAWSLAFESPIPTLEKVLFGGGGNRRTKPNENNQILQNGDAEYGSKKEPNDLIEEIPVKKLLEGEDNEGFCKNDESKEVTEL